MLSKQWNEMILFACEMPFEANILIESDSGKENLMLTSVSITIGYGPYRLRLQGDDNRRRCGVLPAEGVESNGVRTRGGPPPH